jgi:hypothetical protein
MTTTIQESPNPDLEQPRRTPVVSERLPVSKPRFDAGAFFAHKDRLARLCIAVALAALAVAGLALFLAIANARQPVVYVLIDSLDNSAIVSGAPFREAKELHVQQATLATTALLLRNPRDFDQPEILQALFSRGAQAQATALKAIDAAEFAARQIRQKPEITRIEAIPTRQAEIQIQVTGQLVRTGMVRDAPFTELQRFTLRLLLVPNPDLLRNRRQPAIVTQFGLKYEPPTP